MKCNKLRTRWSFCILSFYLLCIQVFTINGMSARHARRLTALGGASAVACTAAYSKYVNDRYENNPENKSAAQLARIVPTPETPDRVTQTHSHLILNNVSCDL